MRVCWRSESRLKNLIGDYFSNLFTSMGSRSDVILNVVSSKLGEQNLLLLDMPFTAEEVKTTIFFMNKDKSLGPDGMNPTFINLFGALLGMMLFRLVCLF